MWFANLLKKRVRSDTNNFVHVKGRVFDPGAEAFAAEDTLANPQYTIGTFPQWGFTPLSPFASSAPMVFQALALPPELPQGFVYGGVQGSPLMTSDSVPYVSGDYYN